MIAVQVGLSGAAAKKQAKSLARMRAQMVKQGQRAELDRLRRLLKDARQRRQGALRLARVACRALRVRTRARVQELRKRELARLRQQGKEMRLQARAQCQARQHRIRTAGGNTADRARRKLDEERRLHAQLARLETAAIRKRAKLVTAGERRQESDGEVSSNLPGELRAVWQKVKRTIKAGPRTTRTEAFLEWAESHPEDVLAMQSHDADREVRQLVKEYEQAERAKHRPVKTKPSEHAKLVAMGLAPSRAAARKHARAIGWEDPPF